MFYNIIYRCIAYKLIVSYFDTRKTLKAIASNPAAMSAIGVPCMALGIWDKLICSRIPQRLQSQCESDCVDMAKR